MGKNVKIKRGMDIPLEGKPSTHIHAISSSTTFAIKPTDFKGLVPKLRIKQGEEVRVGDCLFADKKNDKICFTSPVSGEVVEIVRGERRAITAIKILADSAEYKCKEFDTQNYPTKNVDEIKAILLESSLTNNSYQLKKIFKVLLLTFAFLIGFFSLWYTNGLVNKLELRERAKIATWADATRLIASPKFDGDVNFLFKIIEANTTIPVILTDENGIVKGSRNLDSTGYNGNNFMRDKIKTMELENEPIEIEYIAWSPSFFCNYLILLPLHDYLWYQHILHY